MIGTYAAALMVIVASLPIGAAASRSPATRWSWIAPALGLAVITALAWLLVRLPGEGMAALIGIAVLAVGCGAARPAAGSSAAERAAGRVPRCSPCSRSRSRSWSRATSASSAPASTSTCPSTCSRRVDRRPRSRRRRSCSARATRSARTRSRWRGAELTGGNLVAALHRDHDRRAGDLRADGARRHPRARAAARDVAALLVALPYLVASYLAQGAFKELFEVVFLARLRALAARARPEAGARGAHGVAAAAASRSRARCSSAARSTPTAARGSPGWSARSASGSLLELTVERRRRWRNCAGRCRRRRSRSSCLPARRA